MLASIHTDQILAIHNRLTKQTKSDHEPQISSTSEKNPADFCQRLPKKISLRQDMFLEASEREATLLSRHAYRVLRQFQLERVMVSSTQRNHLRPSNIYINTNSKEGKALGLKYPILLGENGELVAIMKTVRQKLGEGNFGAVFIGMDLDTHKLIAIKYHDLNKASKESITHEKQVMEDIGRLVTAFESDSSVITADCLAWGSDYKHIVDERAKNDFTKDEILYRLDMAIKFFEQVKQFHDKNYLNCDVKLDNMIWDPITKQATLIDFGFARRGRSVQADKVQGTSIYMAPEVMFSRYSRASDAYACGVALIELFTKNDLFDHVDNWKRMINQYNKSKDADVLFNFFKEAAPDLFEEELPEELIPIVEVIVSLIQGDAKDRFSLTQAINLLKTHFDNVQFQLFEAKIQHASASQPFKITFEEMACATIKAHMNEFLLEEGNRKRIHPDSMLIILHHAIIDDNQAVFEKVIDQSKLFDSDNHGFAQMLLKHALENSLESNNFDLLSAFVKASRKKARFHESVQDLQNMIKEKRAVTSNNRRLKMKKGLESLEQKIIPSWLQETGEALKLSALPTEEVADLSVLTFSRQGQEKEPRTSREIKAVPRRRGKRAYK
ncbi:MAG: protein kinase [Proteobacteria bacterium]|nr:protein kinase [Pseudomonadota bacterium]